MASWRPSIAKELVQVSQVIEQSVVADETLLTEISHYVLEAGGKMVRPAVTILAFYAVGGQKVENVIRIAAGLELIHNATLLHDDINDGGLLRRGRPAAYTKYGVQNALVTGDFLFAKAFAIGAKFPPAIIDVTADTCVRLAEGEIRQRRSTRDLTLTEEAYLDIILRKTAGPISAGARVGAMLGEGSEEEIEALAAFGLNLGLAFQVVDDILDVVGDEAILGKPIGTDVREGSPTLLSLYALRHGPSKARAQLARILQAKDASPDDIARALGIIADSGAVDYARTQAAAYGERAKEHLGLVPASPEKIELLKLVDFVLTRES